MKVKFIFNSQFAGTVEKIIEVQDNVSHEDIQAMFPIVLNVPYNKYECSYEVVGDGHIFTLSEMLSYTE